MTWDQLPDLVDTMFHLSSLIGVSSAIRAFIPGRWLGIMCKTLDIIALNVGHARQR